MYGLIGEKLSHSYSKLIHERIGEYDYALIPLSPDALEGFIKCGAYRGINVTIPYKKAVIPMLDSVSDAAQKIGSVNTIVRDENGRLHGHNTDYAGFLSMAERAGISFRGKKVLILGTGGTSLTATAAVRDSGAREIIIVSRSGEVNYENVCALHPDAEVIVNTTPVGMFPDCGGTPIDVSRFPCCEGVLDVVYNPLCTNLVLDARELGIKASGGLPMLVAQATAAAELFTGKILPKEMNERILRSLRAELLNITLIGMPGAGKSSVGKILGEKLGREFIDTDDLIALDAGMSIPEIFERFGEARFREYEREAISRAANRGGQIIATGGGAVLDARNMRAFKRTSRIYLLDRPLTALPREGRPLSQGENALKRLFKERQPLYQEHCDVRIDNSESIENAVKKIMEDFYEAADY